jgi:hypothetical protein
MQSTDSEVGNTFTFRASIRLQPRILRTVRYISVRHVDRVCLHLHRVPFRSTRFANHRTIRSYFVFCSHDKSPVDRPQRVGEPNQASQERIRHMCCKRGSGSRAAQLEEVALSHRYQRCRLMPLICSQLHRTNTQLLTATSATCGNHAQRARINALDTLHQLGDVNNVNLLPGRGNRTGQRDHTFCRRHRNVG